MKKRVNPNEAPKGLKAKKCIAGCTGCYYFRRRPNTVNKTCHFPRSRDLITKTSTILTCLSETRKDGCSVIFVKKD